MTASDSNARRTPELPPYQLLAPPQELGMGTSNTQSDTMAHPTASRSSGQPEGSRYNAAQGPVESPAAPLTPNEHYNFSLTQPAESNSPDQAPPAYSELPGQLHNESSELRTNAIVAEDGRVNIHINQKSRRLSQIFNPQIQQQLSRVERESSPPPPYIPVSLGGAPGQEPPPSLNVVIQVVGSRGDVQPFIALGKVLKETYKHRVRLATHPTFKDFVTEHGLEFFSIGGDPHELMSFMVKNPGLMPGFDTLRSGDVGKRRRGIAEILRGTWRSCIETGDGLGVDPIKQTVEEWMGIEDNNTDAGHKCFVADVIIANPPSFGHIHCAEKLGIPLHMMFTMPWSPTHQFPHPLANIQSSNADPNITNYMSYTLVDMLTWQGLGDIINRFRRESLNLEPISMLWAPGLLARMKIPYTYCWSAALIPKPNDWGHHIHIAGFYFLKMADTYTPPPDLEAFLNAGDPPVYIGFGSIVVDDPNEMTRLIFEAVKKTGKRALVSKGWGGIGADELGIPEGVFMLGNVPHDWLFKRVACVVHHGGAGTTAAGIAAGRPTVICPFFGDQMFWGNMTAKAGAGPAPIPYKEMTSDKLADAIQDALKPESLERAQELSQKISEEMGTHKGAQSFHQMLKVEDLRCSVAPARSAVWRIKRTNIKLSAMAATVLVQEGEIGFNELKLYRPTEYDTDEGPWDPISGGATALIGTMTEMMLGVADFPIETLKLLNIHPDAKKGKGKQVVGSSDASSNVGDQSLRTPTRSGSASTSSSALPGVLSPAPSTAGPTPTSPPTSPGATTPRQGSSSDISTVGSPTTRPSFMAQAMRASTEVSHSRSREHSPRRFREGRNGSSCHPRSKSATNTEESPDLNPGMPERIASFNPDSAIRTGKGIARIIGAGFKSPMDFSMNVAKGFHNLPKLYGEEVRQVDKVTDLQSGVTTAAKEFGMGFFEGLTGLFMDPYRGAQKEGGAGFVKGVGKGIAGVPVRIMGGVFAVPAYAMKGLYQEVLKGKGANIQNYILAARMAQGYDQASGLSPNERAEIVAKWKIVKLHMKKKKNPGEEQLEALQTIMKERKQKKRERWRALFDKVDRSRDRPQARPTFPPAMSDSSSYPDVIVSREENSAAGGQPIATASNQPSLHHTRSFPRRPARSTPQHTQEQVPTANANIQPDAEARDLELAIHRSVSQTAQVQPQPPDEENEEELIALAIQASITDLQNAPAETMNDEEEILQRVLTASVQEAGRRGASEEEQRILEETLRTSLLETRNRRDRGTDSEWDSDTDTEDDEEFQRVMEQSSREYSALRAGAGDGAMTESGAQEEGVVGGESVKENEEDEQIRRVLEESHKAEEERRKEAERMAEEERIVLEYVKRQSLAEEEHRRRMLGGGSSSSSAAASGSGARGGDSGPGS